MELVLGWDDLSAERAAEMISHLPPSIQILMIANAAPYGSSFMDGLIEWITNATHIKCLAIETTCVCELNGGRDVGARLADALSTKNTLEYIVSNHSDLIGSRNVNEWTEALGRMELLKRSSFEETRRWVI